jgi:hypothetical protein
MPRIMTLAFVLPLVFSAASPPEAPRDAIFRAPTRFAPGARAGFRVAVVASAGVLRTEPAAAETVEVLLAGRPVFAGKTGPDGAVAVAFTVPDLADGKHELEIRAAGRSFKQPVTVALDRRILLVSDKPIYQPAQTVHLRALALDGATLRPVESELLFEVEDAKGNKVFKQSRRTSAFGVASADFALADEIALGPYRLRASMGATVAERTVEVKKYVLPKFSVKATADKASYKPGETLKLDLEARYFFGKPVAGGQVAIKASSFDVAFHEFAQLNARTDADGKAKVELKLPDSFVGQPLEQGKALAQLEIKLTDTADHAETVVKTWPVTDQDLELGVIPESGKVVPGVANRIYIVITTPAGEPTRAAVRLKLGTETLEGAAGDGGFAELTFTPKSEDLRQTGGSIVIDAIVEATTPAGLKARRTFELSTESGRDNVLVRTDRALYAWGDALDVTLLATFETGVAFFDVVRQGQTIMTATAPIAKGRATQRVALGPDCFGAIELHAYVVRADGSIARDTKVLYVEPPSELKIAIEPDQPEYLPGQEGAIQFRVTDKEGRGVEAALGVVVVDESVYALQEMQPGLAKIYFTLEQELAKPKAQIKFGGGDVAGAIQERRQQVAQILLAPAEPAPVRAQAVWGENTLAQRYEKLNATLQAVYEVLYQHVVTRRQPFYVAAPGGRRLRDTLLQEAGVKPELADPWGRPLALFELSKLEAAFTVEAWGAILDEEKLAAIHQAMPADLLKFDAVRWDGKAYQFVPGALDAMVARGAIKKEHAVDAFGEKFDLPKLAKLDPAFSAENLARLTLSLRKVDLYEKLLGHATQSVAFVKRGEAYEYADGLLGRLDGSVGDLRGGAMTLSSLAVEHPEFKPSAVAANVEIKKLETLWQALQKAIVELKLVRRDGNTWRYVERPFEVLVERGYARPELLADAAGNARTFWQVVGPRNEFSAVNFMALIMLQNVQALDNAVCSIFHRGSNAATVPADGVDQLVARKAVTEAQASDPWGRRLRIRKTGRKDFSYGCGLMSQGYAVESAGPDGQFGTADDLLDADVGKAKPFAANYATWYRGDAAIVAFGGPGRGYDEDPGVALAGVDRRLRRKNAEEKLSNRIGGGAPPPMPTRPAAEPARALAGALFELEDDGGGEAMPRVREYFPETLAWVPALITDAEGRARLPLTMADSITTWRVTASANSAGGLLGGATAPIRVFQDFFVDIDFPVALTQNDRVGVPVAVYNYLKDEQTVRLVAEAGDGFALEGEAERRVALKPGEVRAVYFPIVARRVGRQELTVRAFGTKMSDAVKRSCEIVPDGLPVEEIVNDRLAGRIERTIRIPDDAIDGASKIVFKCYPGVFSQIAEGVEGMLGAPHG